EHIHTSCRLSHLLAISSVLVVRHVRGTYNAAQTSKRHEAGRRRQNVKRGVLKRLLRNLSTAQEQIVTSRRHWNTVSFHCTPPPPLCNDFHLMQRHEYTALVNTSPDRSSG